MGQVSVNVNGAGEVADTDALALAIASAIQSNAPGVQASIVVSAQVEVTPATAAPAADEAAAS